MNQTEAIRAALDKLGDDADVEDVRSYLKTNKIKTTSSFETIVSHEKRKRKKPPAVPDLSAISDARKLLEELGAEKLAGVLSALERIHAACGGQWETVRKMFEAVAGK